MSLASRIVDEVGEFLHVALLWFVLKPAFDPVDTVVSTLPFPLEPRFWYAAVLAAVGVGVIRYYDPTWNVVRGFIVGVATTATFLSLYLASGVQRVADAGGSWHAFLTVLALWIAALGVGVALAHPRTWRRFRAYFAVD
ncbi:hypothetical protein [Halobellus captivus]|uniref:hypothetical protein n=1 Tax=Halobellus captivus TaxID=2592614 RepID=UPI0011A24860|nr:hypothetical protein [Halobellus captivus]